MRDWRGRSIGSSGSGCPCRRWVSKSTDARPLALTLSLALRASLVRQVFATALHTDDDRTVGYIRALQFSKALSADMSKAINQLAMEGSEGSC